MLLEPGHCIYCKFSIGILTHNFMNSEHSGILYCLIWAHELLSRQIPVGGSAATVLWAVYLYSPEYMNACTIILSVVRVLYRVLN